MERSRVTVEYRHLPQQVFEHESEGVHCVVEELTGSVPEHLTLQQAVDAVQTRLDRWQGPRIGFAEPVTDYADSFRLIVPQVVKWDLWPRVYSCEKCGLVFRTDDKTPLKRRCTCGGIHRQLPYYRVHRCGARMQLSVPQCKVNPTHRMAFHDSGSFITAYFRCTVCQTREEIRPGNCRSCTQPNLQGNEKRMRLVKARDSKAFYPHHVTVVNITARLAKALATPRGPLWAFAHYLGTVSDLNGLVDEASGRAPASKNDDAMRRIMEILGENATDSERETLLGAMNSVRGEEPGLEQAENLLPEDVLDFGRTDRRLVERAFIFHERQPDDIAEIEQRYRANGHHGMAARMSAGMDTAKRLGFSRIAVIRELPIALVGFGFTREFVDHRAQLRPLDAPNRDQVAKRPLVTIESNTEAIYFELDPMTLWTWCHANGWVTGPQPANDVEARVWVASTTYTDDVGPAGLAIQRLTHAWAHTLIHSLEGRSAFGPNSVAEYLVERLGSFMLYVANYSTFNLGGLTTVAEQHLLEWLDGAVEQTTCAHDPICLSERGGCHKCLALAFHCERFNRGLHRGYLLGSQELAITNGWLVHASGT